MLSVMNAGLAREAVHLTGITVGQVFLQLDRRLNVCPGTECSKVSIVNWGRNRYGTRTTSVQVTQHVGQILQLVRHQLVLVNQNYKITKSLANLK